MRKIFVLSLCLFVVCSTGIAQDKIKTLLLSGDDVSAHNWKEIGDTTRNVLQQSGKFDVRISEDPNILDSGKALAGYDLIVLTMYNAKFKTISDQAKENLLNFVKNGKGFAVFHLATGAFKEWDEFKNLCGRCWVMGTSGHGPRYVFKANIADTKHPITEGLQDFYMDDELYAKLQGDADIQVLVTAESDWSKKTEPLCFIKNYGKGRVFNSAFGHDAKAITNSSNEVLLVRGCEWAATGNVTK
jgi:type 1 glutamine amidotransferase